MEEKYEGESKGNENLGSVWYPKFIKFPKLHMKMNFLVKTEPREPCIRTCIRTAFAVRLPERFCTVAYIDVAKALIILVCTALPTSLDLYCSYMPWNTFFSLLGSNSCSGMQQYRAVARKANSVKTVIPPYWKILPPGNGLLYRGRL